MKQLALARAAQDRGTPVPFRLLPGLDVYGGDFVLLMAAPGVGKSFIALDWAKQVASLGEPSWVLYQTTDTTLRTQAGRMARMYGTTADQLSGLALNIRWSDTTLQGVDDLADLVTADEELMGCNPSLIVVDLLLDLAVDMEYEAILGLFTGIRTLAREKGAVVVGVHHADSSLGNKKMPRLEQMQYRMGKYPEVVVGAARPSRDALELETLKVRDGNDGLRELWQFDPARSAIWR